MSVNFPIDGMLLGFELLGNRNVSDFVYHHKDEREGLDVFRLMFYNFNTFRGWFALKLKLLETKEQEPNGHQFHSKCPSAAAKPA